MTSSPLSNNGVAWHSPPWISSFFILIPVLVNIIKEYREVECWHSVRFKLFFFQSPSPRLWRGGITTIIINSNLTTVLSLHFSEVRMVDRDYIHPRMSVIICWRLSTLVYKSLWSHRWTLVVQGIIIQIRWPDHILVWTRTTVGPIGKDTGTENTQIYRILFFQMVFSRQTTVWQETQTPLGWIRVFTDKFNRWWKTRDTVHHSICEDMY